MVLVVNYWNKPSTETNQTCLSALQFDVVQLITFKSATICILQSHSCRMLLQNSFGNYVLLILILAVETLAVIYGTE